MTVDFHLSICSSGCFSVSTIMINYWVGGCLRLDESSRVVYWYRDLSSHMHKRNAQYRIYSNKRPLSDKRLSLINASSTHKNI